MQLPDLPRQLRRKEAKSSVSFRHLLAGLDLKSCNLEMKDTLGKTSLPFRAVTDEQIAYALQSESDKGILIRNTGGSGEPDYHYCRNMPSYICIRYPTAFYLIRVSEFIKEKCVSRRKSLTAERAAEIAELKIKLKP